MNFKIETLCSPVRQLEKLFFVYLSKKYSCQVGMVYIDVCIFILHLFSQQYIILS